MTTKSQDNQDMGWIEQLVNDMYGKDVVGFAYASRDGKLTKNQAKVKIAAKLAQSQAHLLANIERKLPEKDPLTYMELTEETEGEYDAAQAVGTTNFNYGFNDCLDQVKQILKEEGEE